MYHPYEALMCLFPLNLYLVKLQLLTVEFGSGATVAPVPHTMFDTFPGTANITGMPSIENAGKSTCICAMSTAASVL